jgi:apolipoprotein N-acyltransferase
MSLKASVFLCLCSAILLILSFPTPNIEFFAWFGLLPLLFTIEGRKPKEAFLLSYFTGIVFFLAILYWLYYVSLAGLIALVLYLGLYFGLFGLLANVVSRKYEIQILILPSLWVSLEFLRSHLFTGFGWALLGYSQYLNPPLIQISDITGAYGVSFLIVMVNVGIWQTIRKLKIGRTVLIIILCLFFVFSYGFFRLNQPQDGEKIKISLIQGNIPPDIKWDKDSQDFIINRYDQLTRMAAFNLPQLIIWPETAVCVYPDRNEPIWKKILGLVRDMKIPLLVGLVRDVGGRRFNSAALISKEGEIVTYYDKLRLVPFGEYTPKGFIFSFVKMLDQRTGGGEFSQGSEYTIFEVPLSTSSLRFGVLICFEDIFPHLARGFVLRGADFLVNITNDAWFGDTSAPYQHAQASVFRAVENRVGIVRSANTGLSCFIDSRGRITSSLTNAQGKALFITGYKTAKLQIPPKRLSFYSRFGDLFAFLCIFISINYLRRFHSKSS